MPPRPRWHHMLTASREEALQAVQIHNSPLSPRPLEGFLVHMHIAWVYALHAGFERNGIDYRYRLSNGRLDRVDGEPKTWDLTKSIRQRWPNAAHPVRANLELTAALRNRIEHRYERGLMVVSYGFTQALTLNFEAELVGFGEEYSVADRVHLPVSLSAFTREGAAAMVAAQAQLPRRLTDWIIDHRSGLSDELQADRAFEFRIEIMQKRAPKTDADLAVEFVRLDDLAPEERDVYETLERTGRVIVRDKIVEVPSSDDYFSLSPTAVSMEVQDKIGWRFAPAAEFPKAWKALEVRPGSGAVGDAKNETDTRYCRYDKRYDSYSYTPDMVDLIVAHCSTAEDFEELVGWAPKPLPDGT